MKAPARIYLDQSAVSRLATSSDWRQTEIGALLESALESNTGKVWISPSHVVETALASQPDTRHKLADVLLGLADASRITESSQFTLIRAFGRFLNDIIPGSFDPAPYINKYAEQSASCWIGNLGLLAWAGNAPIGPGIKIARLTKLQSQLIHARLLSDPDKGLAEIIKCAKEFAVTTATDPLGIVSLSEEKLLSEIATLAATAKKPTRKTLTAVQKNRDEICSAYGAVDIGSALRCVLGDFPGDVQGTFDIALIIRGWPAMMKKYQVGLLPDNVTGASEDEQSFGSNIYPDVLNACIRAAARAQLTVTTAGYYSLVRELEIRINRSELPSAGATIDSDHVISALLFDIFITHDDMLESSLKTIAKKMGKELEVVSNAKQLAKVIASVSKVTR